MKKTLLALSFAAMALPAFSAEEKTEEKKPESSVTLSGNFGVFSDYRFRGISQTRLAPAAQGGFDFAHKSGFYLGNWNSNVSSEQYLNGAGLEMDFYGGFKTDLAGIGLDIGTLYYYYPGAKYNAANDKYNNHEVYLGLSYGPVSFKTSYAITDYFGLNTNTLTTGTSTKTGDSKGTVYYDLTLSKEIVDKFTFVAHAGRTAYKNYTDLSYTDYKIGFAYDVNGWVYGLNFYANQFSDSAIGKDFNTSGDGTNGLDTKKLYKSAAVVSLSKTF